ncbi:hypothetical protein [Poseidonibacter ostreae]|jgi:hypothetical protein|uniref:Uncharacterized protein n=2 Tax=Poseidonibacter ostreae TaxID=2654171 RepID=A0ABQ6VQ73_9BACT|nr:hypothetical protein [Poseidonibacter ostreae]KAB7892912.1 hypothetical protein GBG18_00110 [Poseidonibacter ostreae]MAC82751.1 hypothetical protein [Arcobacter sp.]|tara:strand:- start:8465 stop:8914 length:450 start_codon:yes stop_codon:yes gene_type:complete
MIKKLIIFVLFTTYLFSNTFEVNKKIDNFSLVDQFDKKHTVKNDIKIIIVSFEKGTGADINEFLSKKPSDFLVTNQAVFIADISGMPSIITSMFALPKMRKYKHTILLIYDEEDKRFIQKNDYSTLYKLDDGVIKSISYIKKEDLKKVF